MVDEGPFRFWLTKHASCLSPIHFQNCPIKTSHSLHVGRLDIDAQDNIKSHVSKETISLDP